MCLCVWLDVPSSISFKVNSNSRIIVLLTAEIPSVACVIAVTLHTKRCNLLFLLILSAPPEYFWGYVALVHQC